MRAASNNLRGIRHVEATAPGNRDSIIWSYTFDDHPVEIFFSGAQITQFGDYCGGGSPLPAGATVVALGWEDLFLDVPDPGDWADDMVLGYSFWTGAAVTFIGARPFSSVKQGGHPALTLTAASLGEAAFVLRDRDRQRWAA